MSAMCVALCVLVAPLKTGKIYFDILFKPMYQKYDHFNM